MMRIYIWSYFLIGWLLTSCWIIFLTMFVYVKWWWPWIW